MSEQTVWRISPDDTAKALQILQDADKELTKRLHHIYGSGADRWPGYEIRIYAMGGTRLLSDVDHGEEIFNLFQKLIKYGLRGGVRLEIQWQ
jgi:hypothetical protein